MAEADGLGGLQMREAGHDDGGVAVRFAGQGQLQTVELLVEVIGGVADIQPHGRRDLIVARACRMQPSGGGADDLFQA